MFPMKKDAPDQTARLQRLADIEGEKIRKLLERINLAIEYGPQVPKDDDEPHKNGKD